MDMPSSSPATSTSTTTTEQNVTWMEKQALKKSRIRQCFTVLVIARILDFACPNTQTLLRYLSISTSFHDSIQNYCDSIWTRIFETNNGFSIRAFLPPKPIKNDPSGKYTDPIPMTPLSLADLFLKVCKSFADHKDASTFWILRNFLQKGFYLINKEFAEFRDPLWVRKEHKMTYLSVFLESFPTIYNARETREIVDLFFGKGVEDKKSDRYDVVASLVVVAKDEEKKKEEASPAAAASAETTANPWKCNAAAIRAAAEKYMELLMEEHEEAEKQEEQQEAKEHKKSASESMFEIMEEMFEHDNCGKDYQRSEITDKILCDASKRNHDLVWLIVKKCPRKIPVGVNTNGILPPPRSPLQNDKMPFYDINVNLRSNGGLPIYNAIYALEENIAILLVKHGVDLTPDPFMQSSPLLAACRAGMPNLVKEILAEGKKVFPFPADYKKCLLEAVSDKGNTALFMAVRSENVEIVKDLVDAGANVLWENIYGFTPITEACNSPSVPPEILRVLVSAVPVESIVDEKEEEEEEQEQEKDPAQLPRKLNRKEAVNKPVLSTPQYCRTESSYAPLVPLVCAVNAKFCSGKRDDSFEKAKILLEAGADPNHTSETEVEMGSSHYDVPRRRALTALAVAVCGGNKVNLDLVDLLVRYGATINSNVLYYADQAVVDRIKNAQQQVKLKQEAKEGE